MNRNDPNFKENFIILHEINSKNSDEYEVIVRKSRISSLEINTNDGGTFIHMDGYEYYAVKESIDEILELL